MGSKAKLYTEIDALRDALRLEMERRVAAERRLEDACGILAPLAQAQPDCTRWLRARNGPSLRAAVARCRAPAGEPTGDARAPAEAAHPEVPDAA